MVLEDFYDQLLKSFELLARAYDLEDQRDDFFSELHTVNYEQLSHRYKYLERADTQVYDSFLRDLYCYLIARDEGLDEALIWKLAN